MASPQTNTRPVLVVEPDARVRAALTAIINATPGLRIAAALTSATNVDAERCARAAAVAVVDVGATNADQSLSLIRQLAAYLPVVAIAAAASDGARAVEAGATVFCDKDGNADCLTAAVATAARRHATAREAAQRPACAPVPTARRPERDNHKQA